MDLVAAALANPNNRAILEQLGRLGLPQPQLTGGAVVQSFWNGIVGLDSRQGIRDYDITYFDQTDLSEAYEAAQVAHARHLLRGIDAEFDIKNQARVHLWYKERFGAAYPQLMSAEHGVSLIPIVAACLALRRNDASNVELVAPYGTQDAEAGILRFNRACPSPVQFTDKAASYRARWPWLRIVEN